VPFCLNQKITGHETLSVHVAFPTRVRSPLWRSFTEYCCKRIEQNAYHRPSRDHVTVPLEPPAAPCQRLHWGRFVRTSSMKLDNGSSDSARNGPAGGRSPTVFRAMRFVPVAPSRRALWNRLRFLIANPIPTASPSTTTPPMCFGPRFACRDILGPSWDPVYDNPGGSDGATPHPLRHVSFFSVSPQSSYRATGRSSHRPGC